MCASVGQRGAVGGGQQARASRAWGTTGTQPRFTLKVIQDAFPETLDKRTGGQLGRERAGPQTSRVQVRATSLEEFQTLRTDQEVQDFSVQVGPITKDAVGRHVASGEVSGWDFDGAPLRGEEHPQGVERTSMRRRWHLRCDWCGISQRHHVHGRCTCRFPFFVYKRASHSATQGPKMREMGLRLLRFIRGDIEALYLDAVVLRGRPTRSGGLPGRAHKARRGKGHRRGHLKLRPSTVMASGRWRCRSWRRMEAICIEA